MAAYGSTSPFVQASPNDRSPPIADPGVAESFPGDFKAYICRTIMVETHAEQRLTGYARVSTYGQTLDAQLEQLRKAGCTSRNIYKEKVTGARPDRRELNRMLDRLAPGDVVTVTRIDRLARSVT